MTNEMTINVEVNGEQCEVEIAPWMTLSDMLRDRLQLRGTHIGCSEGVCGTCTVLVDGETVRGCITLAAQVDGASITTIEGFADDPEARALQQAFVDNFSAQCGFCTPGALAVVQEYLSEVSDSDTFDEAALRKRLNGIICRCTGYQPIVAAVKSVLSKRGVHTDG